MLTINLMLKNSPFPISVQKKDEETAKSLYQELLTAMRSSTLEIIELQCDKETSKTVAVASDQISAVIMSEPSGSATAGKGAGFFAAVTGE